MAHGYLGSIAFETNMDQLSMTNKFEIHSECQSLGEESILSVYLFSSMSKSGLDPFESQDI